MITNQAKKSKLNNYLKVLLWTIIVAVALHIIGQIVLLLANTDNRVVNDVVNRFGLDEELSFPTWVNSMLAFVAMIFTGVVGKSYSNKSKRNTWFVIATICLLISIDEVVALHELLLQALHLLAKFGEGHQGWLANAWLLVMPLVLGGVYLLIKLIRSNLPKDTFKNLTVAITVYLFGALVVEYLTSTFDKSSVYYNFGAVVIEETLEMIGVWLVIKSTIKHIDKHEKELKSKLDKIL